MIKASHRILRSVMTNRLAKLIPVLLISLLVTIFLSSCSQNNFDKIPKTGFTTTYKHDKDNRTPFLSFWENGNAKEWNERVSGVNGKKQLLYVKDINVSYMQEKPKTAQEAKDLEELRTYFKKSLVSHLKEAEKKNSNFILSERKVPVSYTLEIAITSITPTNIKANVLSSALNSVKSATGTLFSKISKQGHISIAGKLWDNNGVLVAEMADYEEDHPAVIGVDLKNFKKYAHHKQNIDVWNDEISSIFTAPSEKKIKGKKFFLNPF